MLARLRSYIAIALRMFRIRTDAGSFPFPFPSADTRVAFLSETIFSITAEIKTSRAIRSRLETTNTAPFSSASMASTNPALSAMSAEPETPAEPEEPEAPTEPEEPAPAEKEDDPDGDGMPGDARINNFVKALEQKPNIVQQMKTIMSVINKITADDDKKRKTGKLMLLKRAIDRAVAQLN